MIRMKKSFNALVCLVWVMSTTTVEAGQTKSNQPTQPRPDLSGKWILDSGDSKLGRERALLKVTGVTLVISHEEPVLTLAETTDYEGLEVTERMTCYTDGRGETNRTSTRATVVKSKTRWDRSLLVTRTSREPMLSPPGSYNPRTGTVAPRGDTRYGDTRYTVQTLAPYVGTTVKRELSADGRTLTIVTSFQGSGSTNVLTKVFRRAP